LNSNDASNYNNLEKAFANQDKYEVISNCKKAIELNPHDAEYYNHLIDKYEKINKEKNCVIVVITQV